MVHIVAIALGGSVGAVLRYFISEIIYQFFSRSFPYGTLVVNVLGSLVMGMLFELFMNRLEINNYWKLGLTTGLLSAFTTFSTFALETLVLIQAGDYMKAAGNILFNILLCILACWVGLILAKLLFSQ